MPIILLTAHADIDTIEQAAGFPIQGYLIKPVLEEQLAACIEVAWRRFQESQAAASRLNEFEQTEETRKIVELARRILTTRGLSEEEAHLTLLKSASEQRIPLRKAAEIIVQTGL